MRPLRTRLSALACAAALALPGVAAAQDSGNDTASDADKDANPVVAVVNGEEIRYDAVVQSARQLPRQYQQQFDRIFPALLDRMVDMELLGEAALDSDVEQTEAFKQRMAEVREQVAREVWLNRKIDDYITDARLREAYEQYKQDNPPQEQVKASHILVEDKELAQKLIDQLGDGAEFAKLASEHSTGPSGKQGGDLGFFGKGEMVEPFSEAAFKLDTGEVVDAPVKTQFGWHVIKVTDKRTQEPKSFEEMRDQLRQQVRQQAVQSVLADLREGAEIETFPERRQQVEDEPELGGGGPAGGAVMPGGRQ
jgi:peptidyl-prolyl cis-trans isomerase C